MASNNPNIPNFLQGPPKRPEFQKQREQKMVNDKAKMMADIHKQYGPNTDSRKPEGINVQTDSAAEPRPLFAEPPQKEELQSWTGGDADEPVVSPEEAARMTKAIHDNLREIDTRPKDPQPEPAPAPRGPVVPESESVHPVLQQLRENFGIVQMPTYKIVLEGIPFVLQLLNSERMAWLHRLVRDAETAGEYSVRVRRAAAAVAVKQIGGVDLSDVYSIPYKNIDGKALDADSRRFRAAEQFYKTLMEGDGKWVVLGDAIYEAYEQNLDVQTNISNSMLDEDREKTYYKCTTAGCQYGIKEFPGEYFCKKHGSPMAAISNLKDELDIPLA